MGNVAVVVPAMAVGRWLHWVVLPDLIDRIWTMKNESCIACSICKGCTGFLDQHVLHQF